MTQEKMQELQALRAENARLKTTESRIAGALGFTGPVSDDMLISTAAAYRRRLDEYGPQSARLRMALEQITEIAREALEPTK